MADITNKNELKRRIELFLDELDYSINEDFCRETMKMMRGFIGHVSHRLDCEESKVKSLKSKLKNYRDLEKQGLLLRLPCKVGDVVYAIDGKKIQTLETENVLALSDDKLCIFAVNCCYHDYISYDMIGKTVFLTREEAEQRLKEMEST